jgi:hypothetical protein
MTRRAHLAVAAASVALLALSTPGCLEARVVIDRVDTVRLEDGRVRVGVELRNIGQDDAPDVCVQVSWSDAEGPIDQRLACTRRYLHSGGLALCPELMCTRNGGIAAESHGPIPPTGVTIEVRVTRVGDYGAMDDYDEVHTLPSP